MKTGFPALCAPLAARGLCAAFVAGLLPLLSGCSVAAYGVGVATMVNDVKVREREDYEEYRRQSEADNAARAKQGLSAEKILSFSQWSRQPGN